jgi:hypothetical protein
VGEGGGGGTGIGFSCKLLYNCKICNISFFFSVKINRFLKICFSFFGQLSTCAEPSCFASCYYGT